MERLLATPLDTSIEMNSIDIISHQTNTDSCKNVNKNIKLKKQPVSKHLSNISPYNAAGDLLSSLAHRLVVEVTTSTPRAPSPLCVQIAFRAKSLKNYDHSDKMRRPCHYKERNKVSELL